jgi:hypothetical protein
LKCLISEHYFIIYLTANGFLPGGSGNTLMMKGKKKMLTINWG